MKVVLEHVIPYRIDRQITSRDDIFEIQFAVLGKFKSYIFDQHSMDAKLFHKIIFNKEYVIEVEIRNNKVYKMLNVFEKVEA